MHIHLRERLEVARKIFERRWVRWALIVWGFIATYDTLLSQFVPEETAKKFPKIHEVVANTSGWLPWQVWLLVLAGIVAVACFEFAYRKAVPKRKAPEAPHRVVERDVGVSEAIAYICFRVWGRSFFEAASSAEVDGAGEYDQFQQAAADGYVTVWGKRDGRSVYEPIPKKFWFDHRIEWFELLKDRPHTQPTKAKTSGLQYAELMTSRAQCEQRWGAQSRSSDIAEHLPDVRVADSPAVFSLFDGPELIPLLEAEKLTAWGRPMHMGEPPPQKISAAIWRDHVLHLVPKGDNPHMRNQTYLKTKNRKETVYYDVFLNSVQLRRIWPHLSSANELVLAHKHEERLQDKQDLRRLELQTAAARRAVAHALDDLYAEGVGHRNLLIPPKADFDFNLERQKLVEWSDRVVAQCSNEHVSVAQKSAFRTLNLFEPTAHHYEGKSEAQVKIEAMWTEKLARLQNIINELG